MSRFILFLTFLLFFNSAWAMPGFIPIQTINYFELELDGETIHVIGRFSLKNPGNCTNLAAGYVVDTTLSPEATARMYATLLTAKASMQYITVFINGCENDMPRIVRITY